ncbi:hypothetical protein V6N13_140539 [Hibiscus sabdariffa]|uniref:Uncharacterized protein n=2 Tax=Hibiscus sabdariffa TaxID=183260 RepID=A0ABR2BKW4_9ROSI
MEESLMHSGRNEVVPNISHSRAVSKCVQDSFIVKSADGAIGVYYRNPCALFPRWFVFVVDMRDLERVECVVGRGASIFVPRFGHDFPSSFPQGIHMLMPQRIGHAYSNAIDNNRRFMTGSEGVFL